MTMTTMATPPSRYAVLLPPELAGVVLLVLVVLDVLEPVPEVELVVEPAVKTRVWTMGWTRVDVCE